MDEDENTHDNWTSIGLAAERVLQRLERRAATSSSGKCFTVSLGDWRIVRVLQGGKERVEIVAIKYPATIFEDVTAQADAENGDLSAGCADVKCTR